MKIINRKIVVLISLLFASQLTYSQLANEIGISINHSKEEALIIDYRHKIKDKYSFTSGISFGISKANFRVGTVEWNDAFQLTRLRGHKKKNINLRFGIERKLKNSVFSIGANYVLGYGKRLYYEYNGYRHFDTISNNWITWGMIGPPKKEFEYPLASANLVRATFDNYSTGINLRISAKIKLTEHLNLNVFAGGYGGILLETNINIEAAPFDFVNDFRPSTSLEYNLQYGVGISYRLCETNKQRNRRLNQESEMFND